MSRRSQVAGRTPSFSVDEAVVALEVGRLVGVPTDTVYGIAAHPGKLGALEALIELKGRDPAQPIALLVADIRQATELAVITGPALELAARHWPGPLTMVMPAAAGVPEWLGDPARGTIGVRVPDHPVALELLGRTGGLAVSSANRSGRPPAVDDRDARAVFEKEVAGYLEGKGRAGLASTVVDVTVEPPVVLRQGPVLFED